MEEQSAVLNRFLVDIFQEILQIEEKSLASQFQDLSLRELHLIEEVCRAEAEGLDNRATAIAAAQRVTAGTLTTAVSLLEKKGYLERHRDERDRRSVRIYPTEKAKMANAGHAEFHRELVEEILAFLSQEEAAVLVRALGNVANFFRDKYQKSKGV